MEAVGVLVVAVVTLVRYRFGQMEMVKIHALLTQRKRVVHGQLDSKYYKFN